MKQMVLMFCIAMVAASSVTAAPRFPDDAPLRAVQFIDANEGWAVGDDGVIWHTIDGGKRWDRQPGGVTGSLRAVHFITPYTGWIVGREQLTPTNSAGIVLATTDGGLTWTRLATNSIPGLHVVKFFDDKHGLAAGDGCALFPTGVFATADGGKSWQSFAGPRQTGWLAADFHDMQSGALGGSWSSLGVLNKSVAGTTEHAAFGGRSVLSLKSSGQRAIAVGQGGLLLTSTDSAGAKWTYGTPRLHQAMPPVALADCDFHCVAVLGEHIWIAGRPGSLVLHSADYGASWELFRTGHSLPLHSVYFHDAKTGWAVGELGTILGTQDGGKTWTALRRGGMRAAALVVSADAETLPLELIASLAGADGYRVAALRIFSSEPLTAPLNSSSEPQRWTDAIRSAGGAGGESLWKFQLAVAPKFKDSRRILEHLEKKLGDKAGDLLVRQLVLAIRIWQPDVILTGSKSEASSELTAEATAEAFRLAGDAKMFPEQIEQLGLSKWSARKQIAEASRDTPSLNIAFDEHHPNLNGSPCDVAAEIGRQILGTAKAPSRERRLHVIENLLQPGGAASIFDGITLAPGGAARRETSQITGADATAFEERVKASQLKRNLEAMARAEFSVIGGPEKVIGQLDGALKKMPPDLGGAAAFSIGQSFVQSGQWHLAREAFYLLLDRYPNDRHCFDALRWLVRYGASSEARRRSELGQFRIESDIEVKPAVGTDAGNVRQTAGSEIVGQQKATLLRNKQEARRWYQATITLEPYLARYGTIAVHDPAMQFCIAAARRSLADTATARKWYDQFLALTESPTQRLTRPDPWRDAASAETWLTSRNSKPSRPVGTCRRTPKKPYLDGKLDDDCWKELAGMSVQNAIGEVGSDYSAKTRFAFDDEFLYIAVECKHPASQFKPKLSARKRDMDLTDHDRVSILLDMDRDFQTYYRFQIDQRGGLAEDCWGDPSWNPRWFVALNSDETGWTAEAAIPLTDLSGDHISAGRIWACHVVRIVPGRGMQTWSQPIDPEGMGLLLFQEEKK